MWCREAAVYIDYLLELDYTNRAQLVVNYSVSTNTS